LSFGPSTDWPVFFVASKDKYVKDAPFDSADGFKTFISSPLDKPQTVEKFFRREFFIDNHDVVCKNFHDLSPVFEGLLFVPDAVLRDDG
jgi:hypothetical protein